MPPRSPKGFGNSSKASQFIERLAIMNRIKNLPEELKELARSNFDVANLSPDDHAYLARNFAYMAGIHLAREMPVWENRGGRFFTEKDGTFTGMASLWHLSGEETVGLMLTQPEAGVPFWYLSEIFTTQAPGCSRVPEEDLDGALNFVNNLLKKPAMAFSATYDGAEKGFIASYGFGGNYCAAKAEAMLPKGCELRGPVCYSSHDNTVAAEVFAYMLNKQAQVLPCRRPYSSLKEILAEENN